MKPEVKVFVTNMINYTRKYGNEDQIDEIYGLVAYISHFSNELEDQESKIKDPAFHRHHNPDKLRHLLYVQNRHIGRLYREIAESLNKV